MNDTCPHHKLAGNVRKPFGDGFSHILGSNIGLYRDNGKENGNYHLGFRV